MGFLIGLLTLILVLDCIVLVFLVLIQLPKKEAGAGLAFGGAASDALFGAGSGNVLTKVTKYAAGIFFVLAIGLSLLQNRLVGRSGSAFTERLDQTENATGGLLPQPGPASTPPISTTNVAPAVSNATPPALPEAAQPPASTNTPAAPK